MPEGGFQLRAIPRLPPHAVHRLRVAELLARVHAPRLLCASIGFGKTTVLVQHLAAAGDRSRYIAVPETDRGETIAGLISSATGIDCGSPERAAKILIEGKLELLIDDAQNASGAARDFLNSLIAATRDCAALILASRERSLVTDRLMLVDGTVVMLNETDLAFDSNEIASLAERYGVAYDDRDLAPFLRETEGWPMVACGMLRSATTRSRPLHAAIPQWIEENSASLRDVVEHEARKKESGEPFLMALRSPGTVTPEAMTTFANDGLFTYRRTSGHHILRPVLQAYARIAPASHEAMTVLDVPPISASLLGDCSVKIGGKPLQFLRRKDAQIFKYLLLKPNGCATRDEVAELFWPGRERSITAQNLRTVCCNIRAALRDCVGAANVKLYFRSEGPVLEVETRIALTDYRRFLNFIESAKIALADGEFARAATQLETAIQLYRGPLTADLPPCDLEAAGAEVEEALGFAERRLATIDGMKQFPRVAFGA